MKASSFSHSEDVLDILRAGATSSEQERILEKVVNGKRLDTVDATILFSQKDISWLGCLADYQRKKQVGSVVYFNRNFHIEPTNVCVFACAFCSYSRLYAHREEGWEHSMEEMLNQVKAYDEQPVTEVHIVGGVHPKMNLDFFCELLRHIKLHRLDLHIKAFTAVELDYMFRKAKVSVREGLQRLQEAGLGSLPGGGAEIFDEQIRKQICADKVSGDGWLAIHREAHLLNIFSNATMLYGHLEHYEHRIDHMLRLRTLQDETGGFQSFIPLKFWNKNNDMSHVAMSSSVDDMKMYAVARLFMDNFNHLKAYWPMMGKPLSQIALSYGVNDLDGTINDSTKIYAMAGAEDQQPTMTTPELVDCIHASGFNAVERNTLYEVVKTYD